MQRRTEHKKKEWLDFSHTLPLTDLLRSVGFEVSPEPPPADEPLAALVSEVFALAVLALDLAVPAYRRVLQGAATETWTGESKSKGRK